MKILATFALSLLACASSFASSGIMPSDGLSLRIGGSPFEAQFTVELSTSGLLKARRFGPPNVTKKSVEIRLSKGQAEELITLASESTDFSSGCGKVADGTAASMTTTYLGVKNTFSCSGAPKWPAGNKTKAFLTTLNKRLPKDLQVF